MYSIGGGSDQGSVYCVPEWRVYWALGDLYPLQTGHIMRILSPLNSPRLSV